MQKKCPNCGSTDIYFDENSGILKCNYCKREYQVEKLNTVDDVFTLKGKVKMAGADNISKEQESIVTLKCESCGANIVVDMKDSNQVRCHWCRNILSIDKKTSSGSVPDMILPFKITKEEAKIEIENFVKSRKFFANKHFKKEFTTDNILGVYLPYMVVDINAHVCFIGKAEQTKKIYRQENTTWYDVISYQIEREFDLTIDNLTIESQQEKLSVLNDTKTNNIIRSILPFDIENCVKYNPYYLRGYTAEKRDINISQLSPFVHSKVMDVAKMQAQNTLTQYDRGIILEKKDLDIIGERYLSSYLPVWLYSYQENKKKKQIIHYVAVNARTKETMGSIPLNRKKLFFVSIMIVIIPICLLICFETNLDSLRPFLPFLFLFFSFCGIAVYFSISLFYQNQDVKSNNIENSKIIVRNMKKEDIPKEERKNVYTQEIEGKNKLDTTNNFIEVPDFIKEDIRKNQGKNNVK